MNKSTNKNKYHILAVEELLDELGGVKVFSKIDLKSGCWKIRMHPEPITIFKIYRGHYEFVFMPFELTNAPFTFQDSINSVFKVYLRRFVLLFYFYDILIYRKSKAEHLQHLESILTLLRDNKLVVSRSKFSFECA